MVRHTSGISGKHQKLAHLINNGRFNQARELAVTLTRRNPDDPGIWYTLAGIHARLGQLDEVIDCCKRVTGLSPNHAGAHYNLAIAREQTGYLSEAASSYRQCLKLEPGNTRALINLGKLLGKEGNHEAALGYFQKAGDADNNLSEAFYCTGVQLQALGRLHEAATAYQKAIHIQPGYFEAMNNLGHVFTELGELAKALGMFESLLAINPESPEAHNNMGVVYESMGKAREAEDSYRKAIAINPDLAETRCHLGFLLASEGRTREALDCFNTNLGLYPGHESSIAGKAVALEKLGKIEDAHTALESAAIGTTSNPDLMLAYCTIMLRRNEAAGAIKQAERLLSKGNIPLKGIADLNFVLGNLNEKDGNYSRAFQYFAAANRASPCTYSHEKHVRYINSIISSTGKEALAKVSGARHTFREVVFIVGMPRSGTSLVEQILASHPDVFGAGELRYLGDIAASFSPPLMKGSNYPASLSSLSQSDVDALARRYTKPVERLAGESRLITDKMPHNFLYLALISILFPNAKVIHVKRHPLDNCLSLYFHGFNPMHAYTTDMNLLGRYYREYQRLMTHWQYSLNIPMLEIHYEDIVNDQESATRQLLDFCQLDWSDDCLKFYDNRRFVKTPSYDQVRQPIYTSSVNRWENYRKFIAPLENALGPDKNRHIAAAQPATGGSGDKFCE